MDKNCSKCNSIMVEAVIDSFPIRIYKADVKPTAETMSSINPCYVCSNCGYIDFYVENVDKFK
ncbi:hypothetical protein [Ureibacillus sp. GCM10028918]|uniref:hypothetical protein n=1 Tax=Ureibacillus sp. GCM10028918 TaxID=3273429 RepID=UPI0036107541